MVPLVLKFLLSVLTAPAARSCIALRSCSFGCLLWLYLAWVVARQQWASARSFSRAWAWPYNTATGLLEKKNGLQNAHACIIVKHALRHARHQ